MQQRLAIRWLLKCGVTAAGLMLACGVATAWFGSGLQLPSTTTRDGTLITFNRYVSEPIPDVVLVGSSLTFRLKEEYFETPGLRNLALAGGSPVTGLEIVANQPRLPKLILVEANVLSRATDTAMVERYARAAMPDRVVSSDQDSRRRLTKTGGTRRLPMRRPLSLLADCCSNRPANLTIISMSIARCSRRTRKIPRLPREPMPNGSQQLIATLEQRGARVLLFETSRFGRTRSRPICQHHARNRSRQVFPIPPDG